MEASSEMVDNFLRKDIDFVGLFSFLLHFIIDVTCNDSDLFFQLAYSFRHETRVVGVLGLIFVLLNQIFQLLYFTFFGLQLAGVPQQFYLQLPHLIRVLLKVVTVSTLQLTYFVTKTSFQLSQVVSLVISFCSQSLGLCNTTGLQRNKFPFIIGALASSFLEGEFGLFLQDFGKGELILAGEGEFFLGRNSGMLGLEGERSMRSGVGMCTCVVMVGREYSGVIEGRVGRELIVLVEHFKNNSILIVFQIETKSCHYFAPFKITR